MITSVIIQGVPKTGTMLMLDVFRYVSCIDKVYPENLMPEELPNLDHSWAWKRPYNCLETEWLQELCPYAAFIFMTRDLRDCLVSWHHYSYPDKTLLMPSGYEGIDGYIQLWKDYNAWVKDNAHKYGMVVSLESLIKDKFMTVRNILKWLHIPFEQSAIEFVDNFISNEKLDDYPHRNWTSPARKVGGWEKYPELMSEHREALQCIQNFVI